LPFLFLFSLLILWPYLAILLAFSVLLLVFIRDSSEILASFFSYFNNICSSNPGHPFAAGITLAKLAAVTMDEEGNETFDTSGALDKLRKVSFLSLFLTGRSS
jgi:glucan phosphoethanolaminetransferase (alkaline phosphatase superfamily)